MLRELNLNEMEMVSGGHETDFFVDKDGQVWKDQEACLEDFQREQTANGASLGATVVGVVGAALTGGIGGLAGAFVGGAFGGLIGALYGTTGHGCFPDPDFGNGSQPDTI